MDFKRSNKNMAEDSIVKSNEGHESVGALLRSHREKAGKEIMTIAGSLRISARYLEAIEDGRNNDLPGNTYAVGFVRSYAEYLGLDEDEIVRRFKEEASGFSPRSDLTFPKPIPEGGVPGGVLLLGGAVVALLAYGIWYVSTNDQQAASIIEPVPERIVEEAVKINPASPQEGSNISINENTSSAPTAEEQKPEEQTSAPSVAITENSATAELAPKIEANETVKSETVDAVVPAENIVAPEQQVNQQPSEQPTSQPDSVEPAQATQTEATPTADSNAVAAEQAQTATTPAVQTPAPVVASTQPENAVQSRITVRAKTNSWIQVRDEADDKLMFTRLLRKGNEYNVPDRSGLTLLTGNAGALEILVDGELVPAIGETGQVRRNVLLDPEQLKSGTAVKD